MVLFEDYHQIRKVLWQVYFPNTSRNYEYQKVDVHVQSYVQRLSTVTIMISTL